ncbi:DUF2000 domain-containing protein [Streptomyces sp. NP160]|nr:DUF2000 domain-containing protein [Streptomyces sp. NP160]
MTDDSAPAPLTPPTERPTRVVLVLADDLGPAEAANAAAVLALSAALGPDALGRVGVDAEGRTDGAITRHPVPVLRAGRVELADLHARAAAVAEVRSVAFGEVARRSRTHTAYLEDLRRTPSEADPAVGVLLVGAQNRVRALTKRFALFGS